MKKLYSVLAALGLVAMSSMALANDVAIVVGVSDYAALDANGDLKYADEDARLFAETIEKRLGFAKKNVIVLTSKPKDGERLSTAANIMAAFDELPNLMKDAAHSRFFFYYSGHGLNSRERGPYLAAQDYNPSNPFSGKAAELTAEKLSDRLSSINAKFAMTVYDMCRPRLANSLDASKETNRQFGIQKKNAELVASVFAAEEGSSFEDDKLEHGLFTYYFCKGLTPEPTSTLPLVRAMNDKGEVTLESLRDYLRDEMAPASQHQLNQDSYHSTGALGAFPEVVSDERGLLTTIAKFDLNAFQPRVTVMQKYSVIRNNALTLFSEKQYEKAGGLFHECAKLEGVGDSKISWSLAAAGVSYQLGKFDALAENCYRDSLESSVRYANVLSNLGLLLAKKGDGRGAEELYREAISSTPNYPYSKNNLGVLLYQKKDFENSEGLFRDAINTLPTFAEAMKNLGVLLRDTSRSFEASTWFKKAIDVNPKYVEARIALAMLYLDDEKLVDAESQFMSVLDIEPSNASVMSMLGVVQLRKNWVEAGEKWFRDAIKADPKFAPARNNLGLVLLQKKEFDLAEEEFRLAINLDPTYVDPVNSLGVLLLTKEDFKGAEAQFRNAIILRDQNGLFHANLASSLLAQGKEEEARKEAKEAQRLGLKKHSVYEKLGMNKR